MQLCRNLRQDIAEGIHPKERPWIKIENATTAELIDQIGKCPSGALTYRMEKKKEE